MLAVSHPNHSSSPLIHLGVMDASGTINPAALNASDLASTISPNLLSQPVTRGTKRSRSPDGSGAPRRNTEGDEPKSNKRNKAAKVDSPALNSQQMSLATSQQPVQTPQIKTQSLPQSTPSQASPARSTPGSATKPPVVKALPTVRDHTTDQLGPEGDEYIPREFDSDGEHKVSKDGSPLYGRKYRCRTFQVPGRGDKLFMLATECARVLGYRDSYLLFNKNRSLFKIIANQAEKDNLIQQEILPYSYRSRQIAIVTARSMFRQFGSRLIENGRRVRDDYWEAKARKQGFTEEDAAGEKRPGAAKAREAAAQEASHQLITSLPQGEIIYSNGPGIEGQPPGMHPVSLAPLPMIHLPSDELRPSSYGNLIRPRQDITGPPYQDRTQSSSANDILSQASQAAEYNKQLSQTRAHRSNYLDDYWKRPHEQPTTRAPTDGDGTTIAPQHLQSPPGGSGMNQVRGQHDQLSHPGSQMMPHAYASYPNQQNPMTSPVQSMHRPMGPGQMHSSSQMTPVSSHRQTPSYPAPYNPNQMWQTQPQPHPSPLAQSQHVSQYGPPQSQTPQQQPQQQNHHQSPMAPPQMPLPQSAGMAYGQMGGVGMSNPANFAGMSRSMYQTNPSPQQFGNLPPGQQQPGLQGWSSGPQDWQRYQ